MNQLERGIAIAFFLNIMNQNKTRFRIASCGLSLTLLVGMIGLASVSGRIEAQTGTAVALSANEKEIATSFEKRVKAYTSLRESIEAKLPKLSKDSTPEQIEAHKKSLQAAVIAARPNAKHGDVFTTDAAALMRRIIKDEFKGKERVELRETVLESDTKGVPIRVNYAYPESKEQVEMAPTLLLRLPQLPKQVKYRFVGRSMVIVDREIGIIVDFMTDALP